LQSPTADPAADPCADAWAEVGVLLGVLSGAVLDELAWHPPSASTAATPAPNVTRGKSPFPPFIPVFPIRQVCLLRAPRLASQKSSTAAWAANR